MPVDPRSTPTEPRRRILVVGPLPPPAGGMANQTRQLVRLLRGEGLEVDLVQTNPAYRPAWMGRIRGLRALARLVPYLLRLWKAAQRAEVLHVMANSGWSWHLFAAPAVLIGRWRGCRVVVNYRGGEAEPFLARAVTWVRPVLRRADVVAVPSGFLAQVFSRHDIDTEILPNIVDLERFRPRAGGDRRRRADGRGEVPPPSPPAASSGPEGEGPGADARPGPHLIVVRNLEPIYDIPTALRAFRRILDIFPAARLSVAGSGPEADALSGLAGELGIAAAVHFTGRLEPAGVTALYRGADLALNPSRVDNMPNSVLEAMAAGVPVVSTAVGGVPWILEDGRTGLLVPPEDPDAMAAAAERILAEPVFAEVLAEAARAECMQYAWPRVRDRLLALYGLPAGSLGDGAGAASDPQLAVPRIAPRASSLPVEERPAPPARKATPPSAPGPSRPGGSGAESLPMAGPVR